MRPLPDGWRWAKLGDVCHTTSGGTPSRSVPSYYEGDIPWVKSGELNDASIDDTQEKITIKALEESSAKAFPSGTLLIALYGATVGKLGVLEVDAATNQAVCAIFTGDDVERDYLFFYLLGHREVLLQDSFGGAQPNISQKIVRSIELPLPPLDEQKRIAAILEDKMATIDQARAAAEGQLEAAQALPAAYLRAVFDSAEAQEWPKRRLGDLALLGPDNGVFKRRSEFGSGVPIVNVSDLYRSLAVNLAQTERVQVSDQELERFAIAPGDLFFCRSSLKREGIGWCCYVREVAEPAVFECHVMRVRPDQERLDPEYLAHYWRHPSVRAEVIGKSRISTMTTMNQKDLADVRVPVPPLVRQKALAAEWTAISGDLEGARSAVRTQIETIDALPTVYLRKAFNGEL